MTKEVHIVDQSLLEQKLIDGHAMPTYKQSPPIDIMHNGYSENNIT